MSTLHSAAPAVAPGRPAAAPGPPETAPGPPEAAPYLMRAPQTEPPYDTEEWRPDTPQTELGLGVPVQGVLALTFRSTEVQSPAHPGRPLRLVPQIDDDHAESVEPPERTPRAQLPDPRELGLRLAIALGEALAGVRPADQLAKSFTDTAFDAVLCAVPARKLALRRTAGTTTRARVKVRSVRSFEPTDGAAEVCAHVLVGNRARALAFRLEGLGGRWICTEAQIG